MKPSPSYPHRQQTYLRAELAREMTPGNGVADCFTQIPHLALNQGPLDESMIRSSLAIMHTRRDCADFALSGLLRILYRFPSSPLLSPTLRAEIEEAVLQFVYWYDQPGIRGMCFHTENHQILFHACELLAGQLYRDRTFANDGHSGAWHVEQAAGRIRQWFDHRARFGFSEWLSNCYFEEDMLALLNLYDFAEDAGIRRKAGYFVDMLLLEIAMHQFQGVMATTHGRTYARYILDGREAPTTAIAWMVFGIGEYRPRTNFALMALCTSDYECPSVIQRIAHHNPSEITIRERHGLNVSDAPAYGLDPASVEDNMFFWACQTSRHPSVRAASLEVARTAEHPWLVDFIETVDEPLERSRVLVENAGATFDNDAVNTALSEANLYTFRTPDYQLSTAQSFRPGRPGYQQHPWQAVLGPRAVVFTTHPGTDDEDGAHTSRPNFWAGNRWLPRAAQYRNVAVIIHHVPADDPRPYSHAWFPRDAFDQVIQRGPWTFAQKGSGYIALFASQPTRWAEDGPYAGKELRAASPDVVWICEMAGEVPGSEVQSGTFEAFVEQITAAPMDLNGLNVVYGSPSAGEVRFGWAGPLTVNGEEVPLTGYPRFDTPYVQAPIGEKRYTVTFEGETLTWEF